MFAANCLAIPLTVYVLAKKLLLCLISSRYLCVQGMKRGFLIKENAHCDNWDDPGGYYSKLHHLIHICHPFVILLLLFLCYLSISATLYSLPLWRGSTWTL
jgi:hypothetical protein